jgi:hypothetical protein
MQTVETFTFLNPLYDESVKPKESSVIEVNIPVTSSPSPDSLVPNPDPYDLSGMREEGDLVKAVSRFPAPSKNALIPYLLSSCKREYDLSPFFSLTADPDIPNTYSSFNILSKGSLLDIIKREANFGRLKYVKPIDDGEKQEEAKNITWRACRSLILPTLHMPPFPPAPSMAKQDIPNNRFTDPLAGSIIFLRKEEALNSDPETVMAVPQSIPVDRSPFSLIVHHLLPDSYELPPYTKQYPKNLFSGSDAIYVRERKNGKEKRKKKKKRVEKPIEVSSMEQRERVKLNYAGGDVGYIIPEEFLMFEVYNCFFIIFF